VNSFFSFPLTSTPFIEHSNTGKREERKEIIPAFHHDNTIPLPADALRLGEKKGGKGRNELGPLVGPFPFHSWSAILSIVGKHERKKKGKGERVVEVIFTVPAASLTSFHRAPICTMLRGKGGEGGGSVYLPYFPFPFLPKRWGKAHLALHRVEDVAEPARQYRGERKMGSAGAEPLNILEPGCWLPKGKQGAVVYLPISFNK